MNKERKKLQEKKRRIARTRAKVSGSTEKPRLSVRRSLSHVYAQLIDDTQGKTVVAVSDIDLDEKIAKGKTKTELATAVGQAVAEQALSKGVKKVVFDRRDKKFHGRVKAVAEGAREKGLNF
jgi:large subunit ribosomal protein L18